MSYISDELKSTIKELLLRESYIFSGECLGSGGFGSVFKATHQFKSEIVAVKIIQLPHYQNPIQSDEIRDIVTKEIKTMKALLSCKHILPYRFDIVHQLAVIIGTEYCSGGSLVKYVSDDRNWRLREPQILRYCHQILCGLYEIHKKGYVHRDIKPENILIDDHDKILIGDLGLTYELGDKSMISSSSIAGTGSYSSYEVANNLSGQSPASDIWSFGLVAIELALGRGFVLNSDRLNLKPNRILKLFETTDFSQDFRYLVSMCFTREPTARPTSETLLGHQCFVQDPPKSGVIFQGQQAHEVPQNTRPYNIEIPTTVIGISPPQYIPPPPPPPQYIPPPPPPPPQYIPPPPPPPPQYIPPPSSQPFVAPRPKNNRKQKKKYGKDNEKYSDKYHKYNIRSDPRTDPIELGPYNFSNTNDDVRSRDTNSGETFEKHPRSYRQGDQQNKNHHQKDNQVRYQKFTPPTSNDVGQQSEAWTNEYAKYPYLGDCKLSISDKFNYFKGVDNVSQLLKVPFFSKRIHDCVGGNSRRLDLKHFYLNDSMEKKIYFTLLLSMITHLNNVIYIESYLDDWFILFFSKATQYLPQIKLLDFYRNNITDDGAKYLSLNFKYINRLESLNLSFNKLSSHGCEYLSQQFIDIRKLSKLRLSKNRIGDEGLISISKQLSNIPLLDDLEVYDCNITFRSIPEFTRNIIHIPGLKILKLDENNIGDDGFRELIYSFRYMGNVEHLNIGSCGFTDNLIDEFRRNVGLLVNLKEIHILKGNKFTDFYHGDIKSSRHAKFF